MRSGHINSAQVGYDLANLSVSFLSFPEINKEKADLDIEKAVMNGFFSFFEYAVSSWTFHLEAGISLATKDPMD